MPMHFGCFEKCKTKKWVVEKEREGDTETERMTARSPHMITKITSTGHLLKRKAFFPRDIATHIIHSVSVKYIKRKYSTVLINHWDLNKRQMNPAVWVPELLWWPLPSAAVLHTANEAGTRGFQLTSPLTGIVGFLHYY